MLPQPPPSLFDVSSSSRVRCHETHLNSVKTFDAGAARQSAMKKASLRRLHAALELLTVFAEYPKGKQENEKPKDVDEQDDAFSKRQMLSKEYVEAGCQDDEAE